MLPSSKFSHSTSNVMVSSVAMSNVPLATPVLPAAVTLVGRDMPYIMTHKPYRTIVLQRRQLEEEEPVGRFAHELCTTLYEGKP